MYYRRRCFADYFLLRTEEVCILRKLMLSGSRRFGVLLSHVLYSSLDAGGWHLPWMKWIMMMVLIFSLGWLTLVRPRPFSSWSPFQKKKSVFLLPYIHVRHLKNWSQWHLLSAWDALRFASIAEDFLHLERYNFLPCGVLSSVGAVFFLH